MPRVTVVVPVWDDISHLALCLESIHAQEELRALEVIVVDDGNPPAKSQQIERLVKALGARADRFVKQSHLGASRARNYGAQFARHPFLFFCDADVTLRPTCLHDLWQKLNFATGDLVAYAYSDFETVTGGQTVKFESQAFDPVRLRVDNYISTMTLVLKRAFGGFPEVERFQDWALWLKLLQAGYRGVYVPSVLFTHFPSGRGISSGSNETALRARAEVLRRFGS